MRTLLEILAVGILAFLLALLVFSLDHDRVTWPWIIGGIGVAAGIVGMARRRRRGVSAPSTIDR